MSSPLSRVLVELLAQHEVLREIMTSCERLVGELEAGCLEPSVLAGLAREIARLRVAFDSHNRYEEQFLRPVLGDLDAFGEVRLDHMITDHVNEHRLVRAALDSSETDELRLTLDRLRSHLATEERYFLSSKVLRDDLVVVESSG
jgi:hemerythrin HHE cation binding domain-containing protein